MSDEKKAKKEAKDGIAYIASFGNIDATFTETLIDTIANKLPDNTKTIYYLFSTGGGTVSIGVAIYNLLRALPYKVVMHNIGSVDSIGNVIFAAGNERYATPNGTFLIHRVRSTMEKNDNLEDNLLREKLNITETEENKIIKIYLEHTKIPKMELLQYFESGELKNAQYAIEKGMIDEIREVKIPEGAEVIVIKGGTTDKSGNPAPKRR